MERKELTPGVEEELDQYKCCAKEKLREVQSTFSNKSEGMR